MFAQAPAPVQKPLNKEQVMTLVSAGMDNEQLAKRIEERGIDFEPTDDFIAALRKAGAQDVVIHALRPAKSEPMNRQQVVQLVAGGVPGERATALVKQRGIDFVPDDTYLETLRVAGADEALVAAVREAGGAIPGQLQVATASNAEVYLDGVVAGHTDPSGNLTIGKVKPGPHALRVSLATKKDFEQSVNVAPGAVNKVSAALADLPGRIKVSSLAGAEVYLDNADRGKTDASGNLVLEDVTPGSHSIRVTAPGRQEYTAAFVAASAGQETTVQAFGQALPGTVRVRATPGAEIFFDNGPIPMPVHACGDYTAKLPPGSHTVRLVARGQAEYQGSFMLESGKETLLTPPRVDLPAASPGRHVDQFFRSTEPLNGQWLYLRLYPDGAVTYNGSQKPPAEVVKDFEQDKQNGCANTWVYYLQGSNIQFPGEAMFGIIDYSGFLKGGTLTFDSVERNTGYRRHWEYQAIGLGPSRHLGLR
jgi:hypothetical protein